jgi:tetratricopeptide (TPR) repeat protein
MLTALRIFLGVARVTIVHGALCALACWSVWAQFVYRVPNRFLGILLAALTAAGALLTVVSWIATVFEGLDAAPKHRRWVEQVYRVCALMTLGFCFYSLYLFTNGKFDLSDPVPHATKLVAIAHDEAVLGPSTPFTWMTLTSWREPGRTERVLMRRDDRERLWAGQPVVILERQGFYGTRWISAVEPDVDAQSREILRLAPDALQIWKDLAWFHVRLLRFDEARRAASEYIARAPEDPEFPVQIASTMMGRDRFVEIAAVLKPVAQRHERYDIYASYGYAVAMQGNREGLKYLERAAAMRPNHWWPHYGLGHAYGVHGDYQRAVTSFERALKLRPGLADVTHQLPTLRQQAARQQAAPKQAAQPRPR